MNRPAFYRILVGGALEGPWSEWFGGMRVEVVPLPDDRLATRLSGEVPDQPSLFGILLKIRDLNLELIRVERVE